MGKVFEGWRRKIGVLTLAMACVFAGGWVRSDSTFDGCFCQMADRTTEIAIVSYQSSIYFWKLTRNYQIAGIHSFSWSCHPLPKNGLVLASPELRWDWRKFGFGVCQYDANGDSMISFAIPYWSIVVPLTLLSSYLLFAKPN